MFLTVRHIMLNTHCCCYITFERIHVLKLDVCNNKLPKLKMEIRFYSFVNLENKYLDMNE